MFAQCHCQSAALPSSHANFSWLVCTHLVAYLIGFARFPVFFNTCSSSLCTIPLHNAIPVSNRAIFSRELLLVVLYPFVAHISFAVTCTGCVFSLLTLSRSYRLLASPVSHASPVPFLHLLIFFAHDSIASLLPCRLFTWIALGCFVPVCCPFGGHLHWLRFQFSYAVPVLQAACLTGFERFHSSFLHLPIFFVHDFIASLVPCHFLT